MPFEAAENLDPSLVFEYEVDSDVWTCSPGIRVLYGIPQGESITTERMLERLVPDDQAPILAMFTRTTREPGSFSCEFRIQDPHGRARRVVMVGESEGLAGDVKRLAGFMVDISESIQRDASDAVEASAEHRAEIEQAKGALMAIFDISEDAAIAVLQRSSQNHNVKLRDVAAGVVHHRTSSPDDATLRIKKWLDSPSPRTHAATED